MATYTPNYNLNKPTFAELADVRTFNGNMDIIDTVMNASQNSIAEPYDSTETYNEGDMVMYELYLYKCLEETTGTWDATKWERAYSAISGAGITYPQDATKYLNGVGQWTVPAGGGDYYSPIIYSTEEREIGVWVDNKPLYQKSFVLSSPIVVNADEWNIISGISITDVENVVSTEIYLNDDKSNNDFGFGKYENGSFKYFTTVQLYIKCFTLCYTKTTDTAGSGSYNTLGVPTHHYSTDEQVVGTWIDGSTLYQKTITLVASATDNTIPYTDDVDLLIKAYGIFADLNGAQTFFPCTDGEDYASVYRATNGVHILCSNWFINNRPNVTITLQYTKVAV